MQITLGQIINGATPKTKEDGTKIEESVLVQLQDINFPVKVSYKIKRLIDKLAPILKTYDEKRNDLIKELGEKQEDGSTKITDIEKIKLFYEKLNELLSTEEEVEFDKIKVEELGDIAVSSKLLLDFVFE